MKHFIYIALCFATITLQAQKTVEKQIDAIDIRHVIVEGDRIFNIQVETTQSQTISVKAQIEGESKEHLVLITDQDESQLNIAVDFQPLFKDANDKLSAHKQISISLKISIPHHLSLDIQSDIAFVKIKGVFETLNVRLLQGSCTVEGIAKRGKVKTIDGDILLTTDRAKIEASTTNGLLKQASLTQGTNTWMLNSIHGDIKIFRSQ